MSADQWQLSLRQLYSTADALEAGVRVDTQAASLHAPLPAGSHEPAPPAERRSLARAVGSTLAHTVVTVSLLAGVSLLIDPVLPQGKRPHLIAAAEGSSEAAAIPQNGTNRP